MISRLDLQEHEPVWAIFNSFSVVLLALSYPAFRLMKLPRN